MWNGKQLPRSKKKSTKTSGHSSDLHWIQTRPLLSYLLTVVPSILIIQLTAFRKKNTPSQPRQTISSSCITSYHPTTQITKTTKKEVVFNWACTAILRFLKSPGKIRLLLIKTFLPFIDWGYCYKKHLTLFNELFPRTFQRPAWSVQSYDVIYCALNYYWFLQPFQHDIQHFMNSYQPASSKWPFDRPNGGHLIPEKVT